MSVARNYIYNTMLQISNILIPFITIPYITRVLDPQGIGIVSYTNSIVQYFILLATLGMTLYGNRTIAYVRNDKEKLNRTFWELFFLKLITTTFSVIAYLIFIYFIHTNYKIVYYIQLINLVSAGFDISYFFMGLEDFKKTSTRSILIRIISTILIFIIIKKPQDYIYYALISASGNLFGQLILWKYIPKYIKITKISIEKLKNHLKDTIKLFIPLIAVQIYTVLDKTMIGVLSTKSELAYYDMSQRLVKITITLVTSIGTVMLPKISNLISTNDKDKITYYSKKVFDYITYSSIFIMIMMIITMPIFVPFYFGKDFLKVKDIIMVISPIILFISWSNFFAIQLMIPMKLEKHITLSVSVAAITNFSLNYFLIPKYQSIGAAISTVIAEFLVTFIQILVIKSYIELKTIFKSIWKHVFSGVLVYVILLQIARFSINQIKKLMLEIFVGLLLYVFIEYLLKSEINSYIISKISKKLKI
jgi:O-antigen/teichoic acid export membrane protein